jgi:hypothetical protein
VKFRIKLDHPKNNPEWDIVRDVARFHGDGLTRGSKFVVLHQVDSFGLEKLERELRNRILEVHREDL